VLTNAARHADTSITVALAEDDAFVELAVANDGPGIPTEHQARIFERFTRVQDARTRDDGGTGLGLAIAREIVHDHGGTIAYDPDYDGARFVIRLPAAGDSPSVEIL
jgi:signal transduction histidine kinase